MGHPIVYCGGCGTGLRHDDVERGRAVTEGAVSYCRSCRPGALPMDTPRRAQAALRSDSGARLPARRTRTPSSRGPLIAGSILVLSSLAVLLLFVAGGGSRPAPQPPRAGDPPAARRAPPRAAAPAAPAPSEAEGLLAELLALEKAGGDPNAILLGCDAARAALKGTAAESRLREIERRASEAKAGRDRERQFETALRNARELIDGEAAAERGEEILAVLASAAAIAGTRRVEVAALESEFRELLRRAAAAPKPAPAPEPEPFLLPANAAPPPLAPDILAFQDGRYPSPEYRGTSDATIEESNPTKARGTAADLEADGDEPSKSGKDRQILLRWDLSSVPPGTRIASAQIVLQISNASNNPYEVYALTRPWSETEATWTRASAARDWELPGARGPGDRRAEAVARFPKAPGGSLRIDLDPALVQAWIDRPAGNHGVAIDAPQSGDGLHARSREYGSPATRPLLRLTLAP